VAGKLVELPVTEGQVVEQGELIARLDDRDLSANLKSAQAESDKAATKAKHRPKYMPCSRRLRDVSFRLLLNQPFGFMALLGLMSLSGMLVKNAVVLLDEINVQLDSARRPFTRLLIPVSVV
jgi:pyruvate/2-oxoglutarate dehydrogenase complex dihydrolipoamide acyltransferase (E2) component